MLQNREGIKTHEGLPNVDRVTKYKKGDILVSNIRPYLKKIWFANNDGGCNNDVIVFRNQKTSNCLNEYLYQVLSMDLFFDFMMANKNGMKMPRGDKRQIPTFPVPLPPLNIQQKIADECIKIDKELETNIKLLVELRETITSLADGYYSTQKRATLGSLCSEPMYGANTPARDGNKESDYRYIRVTDIDDDGNLKEEWKTAEEVEEKYILQPGDMLFARSGATAGKTFLYDDSVGKALYAGYLIKFHPDETQLLPEFLDLMTRSTDYKQWVIQTRGGTAQPNINAQQFSSYQIPLIEIKRQRNTIAEFVSLKKRFNIALEAIAKAPSRKQAILDKYLK